jgi:hypothetical protein
MLVWAGEELHFVLLHSLFSLQQLKLQTFFSSRHRPAMVERKDWSQYEREVFQRRFLRIQLPVERHAAIIAILFKYPNASAEKIAECVDGKTERLPVLRNDKVPTQRVRQPAFCIAQCIVDFAVNFPMRDEMI